MVRGDPCAMPAGDQAGFEWRAAADRLAGRRSRQRRSATGIEPAALRAGVELPALTLPHADAKPVGLKAPNTTGPRVIVFCRGDGCPHCNLELRERQRLLPQLREQGATLAAILPQTPDNSLSTSQKNELVSPVLSDCDPVAAPGLRHRLRRQPRIGCA